MAFQNRITLLDQVDYKNKYMGECKKNNYIRFYKY